MPIKLKAGARMRKRERHGEGEWEGERGGLGRRAVSVKIKPAGSTRCIHISRARSLRS